MYVSVIIPAYNEEKNIEDVIKLAKESKIVNDIIVVNNVSEDKTHEIALSTGVTVLNCDQRGKGYAMEKGIKFSKNETIVFLDADIINYGKDIIEKLAMPILEDTADFVKSAFDREGGRITEIVAKPMLELLFPNICKFSQPLSGMIAGKKSNFEEIEFEKDYGVDIGILLDTIKFGARVQEVYIGKIKNDSKDWTSLPKMSKEVMKTILKKANYKVD